MNTLAEALFSHTLWANLPSGGADVLDTLADLGMPYADAREERDGFLRQWRVRGECDRERCGGPPHAQGLLAAAGTETRKISPRQRISSSTRPAFPDISDARAEPRRNGRGLRRGLSP